ncbi:MAG: radical SAM protein [Deltaproteobacteria bacterium]|jgi:uncharacterized radical SAM superfamily Fe-S cluster-containing enzyme|nr:radical SAM protein [Deltaproteobacteria bacterium]
MSGAILERTESLCPVCLAVLPAEIRRSGEDALLCRRCPEHGEFKEIIWRGPPDFESWKRPKPPAAGVKRQTERQRGCPFDCGLCPEHGQHPCTVLFEITGRCNLTCPVCFAGSGKEDSPGSPPFSDLAALIPQLRRIREQAGPIVLQLSGGEPTLHPRLAELTAAAARLFPAVQLNTNGLLLAGKPGLAKRLAENGLSWVFLQFDGVRESSFEILRGRPLLKTKLAALEACAEAGLGVILVPTVAAGVNDGELGDLVRLAVNTPGVRGVHIQPMTSSGRNSLPGPEHRLTLPEVLRRLEEQTDGLLRPEDAFPPGCEHERCSFHLRYRRLPGGKLIPRPGGNACCSPDCRAGDTASAAPEESSANRDRAVEIILKSWKAPERPPSGTALPMAGSEKADVFDEFLELARKETFSVTAMAFQDVWTADLARLRGCCVQVFRPPDRFIPFCAMNLTRADGKALYSRTEA